MYNNLSKLEVAPIQAEHHSIATGFANEMILRFEPHQCQEMLLTIRQTWEDHIKAEIEKTETHSEYLKKALSAL